MQTEFRLKKSLVIQVLAIAFMLAPIGNLASEVLMSGRSGWWNPVAWYHLLMSLSVVDRTLIFVIFVAGVALLFPKKNSWLLAVLVLLWVSVHNILFFVTSEGPIWSLRLVPALFNIPIVIILFHFRFPYLDKRDHILVGFKTRFIVDIPVVIKESNFQVSSLSAEGGFVLGKAPCADGERIMIEFPDDLVIEFQVIYSVENGFGGEFVSLSKPQKKKLKALLKEAKQNQS